MQSLESTDGDRFEVSQHHWRGAVAAASHLGSVFVYQTNRSLAQNSSLNEWLPTIDYFNRKLLRNHHIRSTCLQSKSFRSQRIQNEARHGGAGL